VERPARRHEFRRAAARTPAVRHRAHGDDSLLQPAARLKPGITGWAQVRLAYAASVEEATEKLQYDLYYIKNLSLWLDLLILVETVKTVVRRRGAR
jgi:lipopolysaccharide/colanic/teichoic acid biosynthesis glycosyltransferase